MKRLLAAPILMVLVWTCALAAKGPEINLVDDKLSISADSVSLGRLLQLFDLATGMKSKVPPELAGRNISVRFSSLGMTDAVRKMFQGQTFDYVVIDGQGIVVTAASVTSGGVEPATSYNPPPTIQIGDQPFVQDFAPVQGIPFQNQQQQPATVQTPFGPMANPRAQPQPNVPLNVPGQQNALFPQTQAVGQPQQPVQIVPGGQPGIQTPFGTVSPYAVPPAPTPNNGLFGATPVFGTPNQQR